MDRVEAVAPARFSCIAEEDSFPEVVEATHTVSHPLKDLGFIVAAFIIAVCPGDVHSV